MTKELYYVDSESLWASGFSRTSEPDVVITGLIQKTHIDHFVYRILTSDFSL